MLTDSDLPIRLAAFRWLEEQRVAHGEVLPWRVLLAGFSVAGERVPLVSQQGIFKPRLCRLPLSIRTSVGSPYRDAFATNGLLQYRYRGGNRTHHENVGLRAAMEEKVPLVYLHGHVEGRYHAIWPVFVVADDRKRPANRTPWRAGGWHGVGPRSRLVRSVTVQAAADSGRSPGSNSAMRVCFQPEASFSRASLSQAHGSMSCSRQVPRTV